ncbi:hypothetical protein ABPG72_005863 [Tetrahymena utriculariae]
MAPDCQLHFCNRYRQQFELLKQPNQFNSIYLLNHYKMYNVAYNVTHVLKIHLTVQLVMKEEYTHLCATVILLYIQTINLIKLQHHVNERAVQINAQFVITIINVFYVGEIGFYPLIVYALKIIMMIL